MRDEMNPYASPKMPGDQLHFGESNPRMPPSPWVSRAISATLAMNVVSIPLSGLLPDLRQSLARNRASDVWIDLVGAATAANLIWLLLMWPIVSLTAVIYTSSADRDTRWWLFKSITAALMLVLWLLGCGLILSQVSIPTDADLD